MIILFSTSSFAQNKWQNMMSDRSANYYDIVADYDIYYKSVMNGATKIPKGNGIKQFERWRNYWESRVDSNGNFPVPGHVMDQMELYYNSEAFTNSSSRTYDPGSGTWEIVGPTPLPANGTGQLNGNGRLNCIAFHPTDVNTIYVGAPAGGVWKSTDAGSTWVEYSAGLTRLGVSSIVIHPTTPNTMYIATGDRDGGDVPGYGVWRSLDGGLSWASHNTGMGNRTINELLMDPANPNNMVAASSNGRIYKTTDGGSNWSASSSLGINPKDIAYHPTNSSIVYASGTEVHRSTDGGTSFTQITSGVPGGVQRIALAVSPNQPNWVYILAGGGSGLIGIYRSTDSGLNYLTRTTTPNILGYETDGSGTASQAWYDLVIAADPTDANKIYTGALNLWKSNDGGATMNCSSYWVGPSGLIDGVHADHHVLEFSPHSNILYNGNDGGIYATNDEGTNWTDISSGLAIAQIYKIGVSQSQEGLVINGYQDNGTGISRGTSFITEIGGDGMECEIDPTDANYIYGSLYYGDIRRSTNNGTSFSVIARDGTNSINEAGAWVTPYQLDPNTPARMLVGYDNVWRSNDVKTPAAGAIVWQKISAFSGTSNIRSIEIAPSNSDVVYVSRYDNNLYRSINATAANPTWTNLGGSLPVTNEPIDIEIDPADPTHLFIALNNNIYESTNSGGAWNDISGSLPNISLNTIVIDKNSPVDAMYVGMDVGVYYKDNTLADWIPYFTNLPNLEITELEIQYGAAACNSKLYGATYGQGLWKSDLKDPGSLAPVACFESNITQGCMGDTFSFTDNSAFTPISWAWTITPATHIYVGGTDATSKNPMVQFSAAGNYTVSLTATNGTGPDTETKTSYINVSTSAIATTFNDDFEAEATCSTATDCGTTVCNLSGSWKNLTNGSEDASDWRIDENGTPSTGTGPSVDYNPGNATGNYAYIEASGGCVSSTAILESGCINLDVNYNFNLAYHMEGVNMGSLHIDVLNGGTWIEDVITSISGNQGAAWNTLTVDLSPYTGQSIKLRIRGITGSDWESDIAIDDINFVAQTILNTNDNYLEQLGVKLYPNPATNELFIANPNQLKISDIKIYDLAGRLIINSDLREMGILKRININNLQSAIYLVQVKGEDGTFIQKLIKE